MPKCANFSHEKKNHLNYTCLLKNRKTIDEWVILSFLPWKLSSKNILLSILSPAITIIQRPIKCCSWAHLHLLCPSWHDLSASHKFKEPQIESRSWTLKIHPQNHKDTTIGQLLNIYLFLKTSLCLTSWSKTSLLGLPFAREEQWESIMLPLLALQFSTVSAFS